MNELSPGENPLTHKLHVLLVDDDPISRDVLSKYLAADGRKVVTAMNGIEALATFQAGHFGLLPTDHRIQLAQVVKEIRANQPTILLTGFSDPALVLNGHSAAVDKLMTKSAAQTELRRPVVEVMDFHLSS